MNKVTVSHSIEINKTPEIVWDYTQDWKRRSEWDYTVASAEYLSQNNPLSVKVTGKGGLRFKVTYKLSERPRLTTLVMSELNSALLKGGGGSWKYEARDGRTLWTQHNTLVLRDGFMGRILRSLASLSLGWTTKTIMKRAKKAIEAN